MASQPSASSNAAAPGFQGSDFFNNLFTDITPLLSLFGEQVTKQFLSTSMGWADSLLLSVLPLGIITILVSAIRVGGSSQLKAFIGRSREPRAEVEADVLSSTSEDVCELWDGDRVVRVQGESETTEHLVVYRPREVKIDFVRLHHHGTLIKCMKIDRQIRSGLFNPFLRPHWRWRSAAKTESSSHAMTSNVDVRSNTGDESLTQLEMAMDSYVLKWSGINRKSPSYSFPCFAVGTLMLATGLFICVQIVDAATEEHNLVPVPEHTGLVIQPLRIQPACRIGDKRFPAYAIFNDPGDSVIRVSRVRADQNFERTTMLCSGIVVLGYAVQFIGLRALPWYIGVLQLGSTLILAGIRSWLRRGLSRRPRTMVLNDEGASLGGWKLTCGIMGIRFAKIPLSKEMIHWILPDNLRKSKALTDASISEKKGLKRTQSYTEPIPGLATSLKLVSQNPRGRFYEARNLARNVSIRIGDRLGDQKVAQCLKDSIRQTVCLLWNAPGMSLKTPRKKDDVIIISFDVLVSCSDEDPPIREELDLRLRPHQESGKWDLAVVSDAQIKGLFNLASIWYEGNPRQARKNKLFRVCKVMGESSKLNDLKYWFSWLRQKTNTQFVNLEGFFDDVNNLSPRQNDILIGYHLLPFCRNLDRPSLQSVSQETKNLKDYFGHTKTYQEQELPWILAQALYSVFLSNLLLKIERLDDRSPVYRGDGWVGDLAESLCEVVCDSGIVDFDTSWGQHELPEEMAEKMPEADALVYPALVAHGLLPDVTSLKPQESPRSPVGTLGYSFYLDYQ
ncbi:MAG: hypothetical protein Q9227_006784 [Pyrenula ochraceoflavens]